MLKKIPLRPIIVGQDRPFTILRVEACHITGKKLEHRVLQKMGKKLQNPFTNKDILLSTLSTLVKTVHDQRRARKITEQWMRKR